MKRFLCTSLTILLILGGITVAFATDTTNPSAANADKTTATVSAADKTTTAAEAVDKAAAAAATDASIKSATTHSAIDTAVTPTAIETTGTAVTIIPDMTFTGTPAKLSLADAYKKMLADSPGAEMAELNKQSADGVARGYGEKVRLINKSEDAGGDYSTTDRNILKIQRTYAAAQGPKNYTTEMNGLKSDTLKNYYTLKELENQALIAKNNLTLKEKLLSNTQLKYKLGTVAKADVLEAEISVNKAKDQMIAAQNGLDTMKMGFNQFMGYNLMQNVTLTDSIKEIPLSSKSLTASIKDALAKRNEMHEAAHNLEMSKMQLENVKAYPGS